MTARLKNEYDTLTTRPERDPAFYLARHRRRQGRGGAGDGRLARFREIAAHRPASVHDVIAGRLDRAFVGEFRHYEWCVRPLCVYCNARLDRRSVTRDHVTPRSHGGPTAPDNLAPACLACNQAKADKPLWRFLLDRGRRVGARAPAQKAA